MTRENKLALVIGFGLILFVGILVSDHFSASKKQLGETRTNQRESADFSDQSPESFRDIAPPRRKSASGAGDRFPPAAELDRQPKQKPLNNVLVMGESTQALQSQVGESSRLPASRRTDATDRELGRDGFYDIKEGETLSIIAERIYNDSAGWKVIAEFNHDRIRDPDNVPVGLTIRLPPKDRVERFIAENKSPSDEVEAEEPERPKFGSYTVRKGDTLSSIAEQVLGSTDRYREIVRLNKDVIDDPNVVPVGTVLKMPAE